MAWLALATEGLFALANVTPQPANVVITAVAVFLRTTKEVAEGHQLAKENRVMVDKMAKRACDVALMIKEHASELKNNPDFKTAMDDIGVVVNELKRVWSSKDDKSKLLEFQGQIDRAVSDFTAKMQHLSHSSGPHQIIEHKDMRTFWKYRMNDTIQDIPWDNFWDQFFHVHKDIEERHFKIDLAGSKAKIEALSRTRGFVSVYDIRLLFNYPTRSIAWHIQKALALGSTSSHQISNTHTLTKVRTKEHQLDEMQTWKGNYTINDCPISIEANLIFRSSTCQVLGKGDDEKHGHFSCEGFLITEQLTPEASILVKWETNDRLDILFKGYIINDRGKTTIEGSCVYPPDATEECGAFELELIGTDIIRSH